MKNGGMNIRHCKLRGEWAELRFMARAAEHGLCVTKPWGDNAQYDFAVEFAGGFARIQVKSTACQVGYQGFTCCVRRSNGIYVGDPFDFVVALVIPEDVWYVIPAVKILGKCNVTLYPGREGTKYAPYSEAWDLLKGGNRIPQIHAYADVAGMAW